VRFSIVVHAAPYSSEAAASAFNFTKALLHQGHEIYRLFFFSDGVHNANRLTILPEDEVNLQQQWDHLITINNLESVVCITSTIKRGVLNKEEAERHNLELNSMYESSEIGGLGQLVDAALNSDRVVNFG
jgi:tRNA 2-thiouridine synthesizing protein D